MAATLRLLPLLLLALATVAAAQGGDPMRPPPSLYADAAAAAASAPALAPLRLQSLRMGPGLRAAAVIDGRLVHVGDLLRDRLRVVSISADAVLLRPASGKSAGEPEHWLRLAADIKKSPSGMEKK